MSAGDGPDAGGAIRPWARNGNPATSVRGGPEQPLEREELWAKFDDCLRVGATGVPARALFDTLMSLDRLEHVNRLPGLAV